MADGHAILQMVYYALGAAALLAAPVLAHIRADRLRFKEAMQRIESLEASRVTRDELRESMRMLVERSDQRWSDHLQADRDKWADHMRWGNDVSLGIQKQIETLEDMAKEMRDTMRDIRRAG